MSNEVFDNTKVLDCTKKLIGIETSYTHFDNEIIIGINSALNVLYQLGVTKEPKTLSSGSETWSSIIGDRNDIEMIKNYIALKVKLMFDPPTSGTYINSIKELINEYEFRLNAECDQNLGD